MAFDRETMIQQLKFEIEMIEKGGYHPSVRQPHRDPQVFRDSATCLNDGLETKIEPCTKCFLCDFVPPAEMAAENPCHHIPLNDRGDTVAWLAERADPETVHLAVLDWLKRTVQHLEDEAARGI